MPQRSALTITTAVVLSGLYVTYARVITPRIAPPVRTLSPLAFTRPTPAPPRQARELAAKWLTEAPWATDAKMQLRTDQAFIYTQSSRHVDGESSVRFEPFAMVWVPRDGKADKRPVTIVSDAAVVKFARDFSFSRPNPGRVVGGALEGNVRLNGPDGMALVGRNFIFTEDAAGIWSDRPAWFRYGPHRGRALGVELELIPAADPTKSKDLAMVGLRSLRLRRDVEVDLVLQDDDERDAIPVQIRCDGSFQYGVESNVATFEQNVRVTRPTAGELFESLECDLLTLVFEPKTAERPADLQAELASDEEPDERQRAETDLAFRRMRAEGKRVVVVSQENELTALMTELDYDARSKTAVMHAPGSVRIVHETGRLMSARITLTHDDDGELVSAWCEGPGWLEQRDKANAATQVTARWQRLLHKHPDPQTGLDVIELHGDVVVHRPADKTGLAAELVKLWYLPEGGSAAASADPSASPDEHQPQAKFVVALGNVAIESPGLQVRRTNRLDVRFEQAIVQSFPPISPAAHSQGDSRQPFAHWAGHVPATGPEEETAQQDTERPDDKPLEVISDSIQVRVLTHPERSPEVAEIWTDGNVHLRQQREPGTEPLRLAGQRMHLQNRGEIDQVVHLFGQPAHIRDQGVHIEGGRVHFDRKKNLAWVDGRGVLEVPVDKDLEGRPLAGSQKLSVWWNENMTFDGRRAQFFGNVHAELADNSMDCYEMEVVLTQPISFSEKRPNQEVEIEHVFCKLGVDFQGYEYQGNTLLAVRRGHFWQLNVNQVTGETEAVGPGWVTQWQRGDGRRASFTPAATVQANQPLKPDTAEWEYTRVDFAGTSTGNLKQRATTFNDRVTIVYGPVERPLETIDPDELSKDAGWMQCDALTLTQIEESDDRPAYYEALARGNAKLEGRTFHALADEISFDESKELYILRAVGRRHATIWRETHLGGQRSRVDAQRLEFIPSRNQLKADQTVGVQAVE